MDLKNKIAVITGISKGIGKALAEQLLEKGAIVAGWGIHRPDWEHENLHFFNADIRKPEEVAVAFANTVNSLGENIHILVNNAGLGYFGYFDEMPPEQFLEIFEANVY